MTEKISGGAFKQMVAFGAACITREKQAINDLNVFPVPDGDTGTNMSLTIQTAAAELKKCEPATVGEAAKITASALLRGARGNSGVILSLLFRGLSKSAKGLEEMDGVQLAAAMSEGVTTAYGAVMKPAEGTVLTVSRLAAARAEEAAQEQNCAEYVLAEAIATGYETLAETTEMNPVLKKAGVVDAGGMGFVVILQGMLDELHGIPAPADDQEPSPVPQREKADFGGFETGEIQFGYCTEFICSRDTQKDPEALRAFLNGLGDSLVLVDDDEIIKVHVHTNHPGKVLEEALTYGGLLTVKVENMRQQHTELLQQEGETAPRQSLPPEKKYGFVAVAAGEGLAKVFFDLGVDGVIQGGQTMNPSTEDILKEIQKTPAEIVYVLPNNKNIILAAQQCVDLVEDKKVVVLQAKTVPQGISAMIAMNPDGEEAENTAAMEEAMGQVTTMEITYAARDSSFDGNAIQAGDYLLLVDNQLFGTEKSMETALEKLAQESQERGGEFISIFYGEGVQQGEAEQALAQFEAACPEAEITLLEGGQPVYHYLISVE